MLPKTIQDMIVSVDGVGYRGKCNIDQMPKLTRTMVDHQAGGMDGSVEIDVGQEKLETELTFNEHTADIINTHGECKADGVLIRLNGSAESQSGACATNAIEIVMRGRFKEIDLGGYKPKEQTEMKVSGTLTYLKYSVNGIDLIEIDILNYVFNVNGKDKYAERRKALKI